MIDITEDLAALTAALNTVTELEAAYAAARDAVNVASRAVPEDGKPWMRDYVSIIIAENAAAGAYNALSDALTTSERAYGVIITAVCNAVVAAN